MKEMKRTLVLAAIVGVAAVAAGCSVLAPQPDRSQFVMLTSIAGGGPAASVSYIVDPRLSIAVGPVDLPGYLRRPEVVTRDTSNRVRLSEDKLWAEPLGSNFQRVLAENLSQLLGTQRVMLFPWYATSRPEFQVAVQVERFDTTSDGRSELTARWVIRDGRSGKDLFATKSNVTGIVSKGDTGGAEALSRDLGAFSREIAARIAELSREAKTTRGASEALPGAGHHAPLVDSAGASVSRN
jgi:uncharacterized protein